MCHIYVISIQQNLHSSFQCPIATVQFFITETHYLIVHGALVPYIKKKRRRSDPVLWQNPLYQQKIRKPKDNTHKRYQKLRLHNDCGPI